MQQTIKPAGAGHETLLVLALCAAIVIGAGGVIALRQPPVQHAVADTHVLDARRDLNAAEQGVFADLRVAFDEIAMQAEGGRWPTVAALAESSLPPFVADVSARRRGGHAWQQIRSGEITAYAGMSADSKVAGSLLLRLPVADGHPHGGEASEPDIWLARANTLPISLDDAALTAAGWQRVAVQFDAGVTRQTTHP